MKHVFLGIIYGLIFLSGCSSSDDNDSITCSIKDYFTGEPLANFLVSFDGIEDTTYYALSNDDGEFTLNNLGENIEYLLWANFQRPTQIDSMEMMWRYLIDGQYEDSLWVYKGINHLLRLKPAGLTKFKHPKIKNRITIIDTLVVKIYNQTDTLSINKLTSVIFYLLPSMLLDIEIIELNNGKQLQREFKHYLPAAFSKFGNSDTTQIIRNNFVVHIPE